MSKKIVDEKIQSVLEMYKNLKNKIGEKVIIDYFKVISGHTKCIKETGQLESVIAFTGVSTESSYTPFIGNVIIYKISTIDGAILYLNRESLKYYMYDIDFNKHRDEIKKDFYGEEYVNKKRARHETRYAKDPIKEKYNELRRQIIIKTTKKRALEECLPIIKEGTQEDWVKLVEKNCEDDYSRFILDSVVYALKQLEEGVEFQEICDEMGELTGFMAGCVASSIYHFSKRGEEFKRFWNKLNNGDPEIDGTINPAILRLK